jgi:hypothetical protein
MRGYASKLKKGLPKETKSLCPECRRIIDALIFEKDGKVLISKECPEHGKFEHVYWEDVNLYLKAEEYAYDGRGVENPNTKATRECPSNCGLCENHMSSTVLANIDVTNRCNLSCEFCFANANVRGYVYEPTLEQIREMLRYLREERPVPTPAVQFSGGEPTVRDDIVEIVKMAKEMGFKQIQLATNGIILAKNKELLKELREAGLSTIYLHFDGVSEDVDPHIEAKKRLLDNCREVNQGIVLVPTIIRGFNDHQIGDIIRFAIKNVDVIRGVNFQPVAFTGAASAKELEGRITISGLYEEIERQTNGMIKKEDFYPVPCVVPISKLVEAYAESPQVEFTSHPHCGGATYLFVEGDNAIPINRFVDVDRFFEFIVRTAQSIKNAPMKKIAKPVILLKALSELPKYIDEEKAPKSVNLGEMIKRVLRDMDYRSLGEFHYKALFVGTMHFQDIYNYDVERVRRCVIHYATPDEKRRIVPFCSYNSGPTYREEIERKFSVPLEEWRNMRGEQKG